MVTIYESGLLIKSKFLNGLNKVTAVLQVYAPGHRKQRLWGCNCISQTRHFLKLCLDAEYLCTLDTQGDCPWKKEEESCSLSAVCMYFVLEDTILSATGVTGRYKTQVTGHRAQVTGHCFTYTESILNIHKS